MCTREKCLRLKPCPFFVRRANEVIPYATTRLNIVSVHNYVYIAGSKVSYLDIWKFVPASGSQFAYTALVEI
jgi:hypothetical protein